MRRAGLDKAADSDFAKVSPGVIPEVQFWWTVPQLLRANDESLLGGATWDALLREAVVIVAANKPSADWGTLHTPKLKHRCRRYFPIMPTLSTRIATPSMVTMIACSWRAIR
jgi:penicillin amidase